MRFEGREWRFDLPVVAGTVTTTPGKPMDHVHMAVQADGRKFEFKEE